MGQGLCVFPTCEKRRKERLPRRWPLLFALKGGDSVRKLPDLYELIAADARATEPVPPAKRVPAYLRQYTSPEVAERARNLPTYRDPTARKAISNAEPKRRRRRRRALQP